MYNTTFGGDVPEIPQWTGPPDAILRTQILLYISLAVSLFSVFFSILAKQWLNQYSLVKVWGSNIERSRNRQHKLEGLTAWNLNYMFEALPLLLQLSLLLLGCALSQYLLTIDTSIAVVAIIFTSEAIAFYFLYVTAAVLSPGCPYQTPISRTLSRINRELVLQILRHSLLQVRLVPSLRRSETVGVAQAHDSRRLRDWIRYFLDWIVYLRRIRDQPLTVVEMVISGTNDGADAQLIDDTSLPEQEPDVLDIHCVSWVLQESPDRGVQLSALEYLATMEKMADFKPSLVASCFNILIGCVGVTNHNVVVTRGQEKLATASATCFLRTFSHLSVMDPMSGMFRYVRRRFNRVFPPDIDLQGSSPFHYILSAIRRLLSQDAERRPRIEWRGYKPPGHEHTRVARAITELAQSESRGSDRRKVPRWIIRFALHSLSLDPPPSTSVVIDCLLVIAIDLGCEVSSARTTALNER